MRLAHAALAGLALVSLAACGGDGTGDPTQPSLRYPDVGGTYQVDGTFDQIPATSASVGGSFTVAQPDRNQPQVTVTLNLVGRIAGSADTPFVGTRTGTVSSEGVVEFNVGDASASWIFRGTSSGRVITGTHVLSSSSGALTGRFTATKP